MNTRDLEEAVPESIVDRRYAVKREIARGGMGCVFEAEHLVTRARVAIKTLTRPSLDHLPAHARLMREARVLGAIRHPMVVAVYDAGVCEKHGPFIALEMIEGRPLDGILLAKNVLPAGQAVAMIIQLCDALDSVNRRGIVHRDVKPSNVLIARTAIGDQVELIDFGVARVGPEDDVTAEKLTKMGELLGTVEYMSPEQLMGTGAIDARTDVYGAGVVLYECLTGEVPFSGSPTAVMANLISGNRPPPIRGKRDDVPLELEAALRTALEVDMKKRFASTRDFALACTAAMGGSIPQLDLLDVRDDRNKPAEPAPVKLEKPTLSQARRQYVRAPYVTPARLILESGATCDGRTEDISEGGVLIVTETECARDQKVKLRIPLPASGRLVVLSAITKWIKTRRNQRAIGVEFVDAPEDVKNEIRAYAEMMSGAPQAPPSVT